MLAIVFGLVFMALGLWGLLSWWGDFLIILKGLFPVLFFFGGVIAVIAGATSIRDMRAARPVSEKAKETENNKE